MKVSVFKNIFDITEPIHVDVLNILTRIQEGGNKELIEKIRKEKDKNIRSNIKKDLKSICFSGEFSKRADNCLLKHSGLIVLDIDAVSKNKLQGLKSTVCKSPYTYACFISPSGNGLKILIKIPNNVEHHFGIFKALEKHFNEILTPYRVDESGKNVSRVCYESYDPDLYHYPDSDIWAEVYSKEKIEKEVENPNEVINMLQVWIDKQNTYNEGNRNNFIFKFASGMCRYGIPDGEALSYIKQKYPDFPEKELITAVKSAYKTNQFGIEKFTKSTEKGKNTKVNHEINVPEKAVTAFWDIIEKGKDKGKAVIDTSQLLKFIAANGYGIYRHVNDVTEWNFVKIKNMIVELVDVLDIKRTVLDYIIINAPRQVFDEFQMKDRYFQRTFLNALPIIEIKKIIDEPYSSYVFFDKNYYEISKSKISKKDYIDLKGRHIWKNQLCSQNITKYHKKNNESDWASFIWRTMNKDLTKYNAIRTAIGYILHTYKKRSLTKIPYFCDFDSGELDGMASGGSGKSLVHECFRYVRNVIYLDGKTFKKDNSFNLQRVSDDTQIVVMEDFSGDIQQLFVKVTGDFETEKKNKDSKVQNFKESPKVAINSNSLPRGFSDSYARRMHISQFGNHYNERYTPIDEFKKDFFDDWNQNEWDMFYSWIFDCIQFYLQNGLIKEKAIDAKYKYMVKNTDLDFTEYWLQKNTFDLSKWQNGRKIVSDFKFSNESEISEQQFYANMRKMAKIYGWEYKSKKTGINREIMLDGFDLPLSKEDDFIETEGEDLPF